MYGVKPFLEFPVRSFESNDEKYRFTGKERDNETELDYFEARYFDSDVTHFIQVDKMADVAPNWTPYRYCFSNPIMFVDPSGNNEDDFYFNKKGEMVGYKVTDQKDRILQEDIEGKESIKVNGENMNFSENKNPGFSVVKIYVDPTGIGHTAIGFDGETYGFYPTDKNGDGDYNKSDMYNSPLNLEIKSTSEFEVEYSKANTFFTKVTPSEKLKLNSWLKAREQTISNGEGGDYALFGNNCTTQACLALNFTFKTSGFDFITPVGFNMFLNTLAQQPNSRIFSSNKGQGAVDPNSTVGQKKQ